MARVFLFCAEVELHPQEEPHPFPLLLLSIINSSIGNESNMATSEKKPYSTICVKYPQRSYDRM